MINWIKDLLNIERKEIEELKTEDGGRIKTTTYIKGKPYRKVTNIFPPRFNSEWTEEEQADYWRKWHNSRNPYA